jgi:hypothetical protein
VRGLRRSRSAQGLLRPVVVPVLLLERQLGPGASVLGGQLLGALDACPEAARSGSQRQLGVNVQPPPDVDHREEEVAELLEVARVGLDLGRLIPVELGLQLGQLRLEIGQRAGQIGVLEPDVARATLHLARL